MHNPAWFLHVRPDADQPCNDTDGLLSIRGLKKERQGTHPRTPFFFNFQM